MAPRAMRRAALVAAAAAAAFVAAQARAPVDKTIMYDDCLTPADDPSVAKGNYFNLCIRGHEFADERFAYTFTKTTVQESTFTGVTFANTPDKRMNLTRASWKDVRFTDSTFASYTKDPVVFDYTTFTNVEFNGCVFDATANVLFSNFAFRNVSFIDCKFQSDTQFELGEMTNVFFNGTSFKRSEDAKTVSGNDRITFDRVTMRSVFFTKDDFITPVVFESAAVADMHVNDTNFGAFYCHEIPEKRDAAPKKFAAFNDTLFENVAFRDSVSCDHVTWRGMYMSEVRFEREAYFSASNILDIYFDTVLAKSRDRSCHTLDFSHSNIRRGVFANVTAECKANFGGASFTQVNVKAFNAAQPDFSDATFNDQEYVDGQCCTNACVNLQCKCNVTQPSGRCPEGSSKVNINKPSTCFPGHATVALHTGATVRIADLAHADRVAVSAADHSDVYMFGHRDPAATASFVRIDSPASAAPLLISPRHYLYVNGRLATAETVAPGDRLRGADGADTLVVSAVSREVHAGAYAPTTLAGELLVDGVVVSSYTDVMHPATAHRLLQPLRALYATPLRGVVARVTAAMHTQSWDWLARRLAVEEGPDQL